MITSLGLKTIRRAKKIKKARFSITNVSLKDISKIIKEFEDLTYEGLVKKISKHIPNESYLYPSINMEKCMMIFNMQVGLVRMQMTDTQKMNNSDTSTQKIPNSHVCSLDESKSHFCSMEESE